MLRTILLIQLLLSAVLISRSQNISAKLLDKDTNEPIPFATIQVAINGGVMSNEEGDFQFEKPENIKPNDSIKITSLGFKTKRLALLDTIPSIIYLDVEVFKIAPVILTNKKVSIDEILEKVKANLQNNYKTDYSKNTIFIRETYKQRFKHFDFDLKKSTIDNIDQELFDSVLHKIPNKFTALIESYGDAYLKDNVAGKMQTKKSMQIQSKHEKTSIQGLQDDFFNTLRENTKPNSYLVIKSGLFRIDKTESIDSIMSYENKESNKEPVAKREANQRHRNAILNDLMKNLFINEDASVDMIHSSNRYNFEKIGYVEIEGGLAYVLEFIPKGKAKYKGKLYVHTEDYAIIKSEITGANKIFDKHFNMFGITANDLSYTSTVIFKKENDSKYHLKYFKKESVQQVGINRPIKIIEKNKVVKGKNKQNEVSFQMHIAIQNYDKKEMVFTSPNSLSKETYESLKLKNDFEIGEFNAYNKQFWKGYNIITPEKAIQELKIE